MGRSFISVLFAILSIGAIAPIPAQAQGVKSNIVHPLILFKRNESIDFARKADCAMAAKHVPDWEESEGSQSFKELFDDEFPAACTGLFDKSFASSVKSKLAETGKPHKDLTMREFQDIVLDKIGIEAILIEENDAKRVYAYAIDRREVITRTFGRYSFATGAADYDLKRSVIWAKSVCPVPKTGTPCGTPKAGGAQRFRRALERMIEAVDPNLDDPDAPDRKDPAEEVAGPLTRFRDRIDQIQIHGFYIEDLSRKKFNESIGRDDSREVCASDGRNADDIFRLALNCYVPNPDNTSMEKYPDYRVLLVYEPGSTLKRETSGGEIIALKAPDDRVGAPKEQFLIQFQELADAATTIQLRRDKKIFPSQFQLRIADEPTEFVKTASSDAAKIAVTINQQTKREEFAIDAAIGYRLSNTVDPVKEDCEETPWLFCHAQISVSPFVAWQRTQSDVRDAGEDPERTRDVVFGGLQLGFEKIAYVNKDEKFADFRRPPDWRSSLAFEYITDGDFEADVQRYSFLTAPPWPDSLPTLGYRGRLRLSEIFLTENQIKQNAINDRGSIERCNSRLACSMWFEWDGNFAIDHIDVDTAPFNLSTKDDLTDRLDIIDGTRFGFDLSAAIGARSPFAFTSDTPWIEFKAEFQKRETFRSDGRQVELFKSSMALTDTHDGSFSVGIGYERGEDLRLGNELEQWKVQLGLKH